MYKVKAIPVTGHGDLWSCEVLRIPHCLDNWLSDGGEVVSLTHRPRFSPSGNYFSVPNIHVCYRLSKLQGLVEPKLLGK
jgi:hypothetical protein